MALSFASLKATLPKPFKVHNLFVDGGVAAGGTPKYPLVGLNPTEPPTNTAEGGVYYDDDLRQLMVYNGTTWVPTNGIAGARPVYAAATTLTAADSGAFCLFATAAGYTYTLPTPAAGLWFDFYVGVTITSVGAKILTPADTFLLGDFIQSTDGTYTTTSHAANGTTIRSWNGNGTTTGGYIGDRITVVGLSATQWSVFGYGRATGTEATPFATS